MSKITQTQINKYLKAHKHPEYIEVDYDDFKIQLKTDLTIAEKYEFVEYVVKEAYINGVYSPLYRDVAFTIAFAMVCTDMTLPMTTVDEHEVIDSQKSYDMIVELDLLKKCEDIPYVNELRCYIDKRIEFENARLLSLPNASDDAIEAVAYLATKGIELIEVAIKQLDKNGDKLFKNLTPKKIEKWLEGLQKAIIQPNQGVGSN